MIQVAVKRGLGDKKAPVIRDDRVVSEQMAIRIGANFLNKSWYIVHARSLNVPHRQSINDNLVVRIEEGKIPIAGKHHIASVTITGNREGIWNEIETESYEDFR